MLRWISVALFRERPKTSLRVSLEISAGLPGMTSALRISRKALAWVKRTDPPKLLKVKLPTSCVSGFSILTIRVPREGARGLGRAVQGGAGDVAEGLAGDQRGAAGDDVGAADFEEGVGLVKADRSAEVAEGEAADFLRFGVLDIDDPRCAAERGDPHADRRAADPDRSDGRRYVHLAAGRDFAGDEDEGPLNQGNPHGVGGAGRVVDEFVDHHAGIGGQREHRVVGEENAEVRADPGRNDIALKYRVAFIEIAAGAVGSLHAGNAVQKADLAYRRPEGGVASLCKPGRNCGAGQGLDGFRRQARAFRGFQWRRRDLSEVVAEQIGRAH